MLEPFTGCMQEERPETPGGLATKTTAQLFLGPWTMSNRSSFALFLTVQAFKNAHLYLLQKAKLFFLKCCRDQVKPGLN